MTTPHGIQFAVHLITSHFGNLVASVCENLLKRGPLTLTLLIRFTKLTPSQVKNCLLILIQHSCVQAFASDQPGPGGSEIKVTQYLVLFDNILHRLRFPKFLTIVSQELDKNCEELLEGLLQHGRLTMEQICERAKSSKGDPAVQDAVQESFQKLLNLRFVERCPDPEPFIEPPKPAPKGNSKSAKLRQASPTTEMRVLEAAAPIEALRFSILTTYRTNSDAEKNGDDSAKTRVGEKRKQAEADSDDEFNFKEDGVVLWRANFEEFIRCLRHKACVENVRGRMDDGTATVLKAMLDATRSLETKVKMEDSVPLSMSTIFEEVIKTEAGRSLTLDRVRASLVQLDCPFSGIDETYSVELKKIIELARIEEVESIVLNRYGREAYRMFRLLSKRDSDQLLETNKIADMTFVEKKDTPKLLYKLWKDDYLHMQKLVVAGRPGSRGGTFMLWKVDKLNVWKHVLDEMYHAALNLSLRVIHEQEQKKELLTLPPEKRTGPLEKEFKQLRNTKIYLESALMKLDDSIMLFHNF